MGKCLILFVYLTILLWSAKSSDVGRVAKIIMEQFFAKRLHFASKMGILMIKEDDCYGTNIKCICTSGT